MIFWTQYINLKFSAHSHPSWAHLSLAHVVIFYLLTSCNSRGGCCSLASMAGKTQGRAHLLLLHGLGREEEERRGAGSTCCCNRDKGGREGASTTIREGGSWPPLLCLRMKKGEEGRAPWTGKKRSSLLSRTEKGREWCVGEGRGWDAIYRAKLWTFQTARAGGRWWQSDFGRPFSSFSPWNRIKVTVRNIFLDVHSTNLVHHLRWFEHLLESYRPTKTGLSVG
jgi:hypothetical protein